MQEIPAKEKFITLLESTNRWGMNNVIQYLSDSDFFTAPASTRFHGAYEGGLLEHSLQVYEEICKLASLYSTKEINASSLIIAALLHDVCKVNFYKSDTRNVKVNGVWEQVPVYMIDDKMPLGHGEKSVIILQNYIKLSADEIFAIRWHMGGFDDTAKSYVGGMQLSAALSNCPLLVLLHMADLSASYLIDGKEEQSNGKNQQS